LRRIGQFEYYAKVKPDTPLREEMPRLPFPNCRSLCSISDSENMRLMTFDSEALRAGMGSSFPQPATVH
jgi:hypothetical protein